MKHVSSFVCRRDLGLSVTAAVHLLIAYVLYLFLYFLQNGGIIVFCHRVVFSPAHKECRESVESYFLAILIAAALAGVIGILALIFKTISSPERRAALKRFLLFFVPIAAVLLLLGLIPIEFGLGMLGSATIYLLVPIACFVGILLLLSLTYINIFKKRNPFIAVPAVLVTCVLLIAAHFYILSALEAVANHDRDLDSFPKRTTYCDEFWFERYKQRCEERVKRLP